MTDAEVAGALVAAMLIESEARDYWQQTPDLPERDAALIVGRHATALRKSLEGWIARRAMRAQLTGAEARKVG